MKFIIYYLQDDSDSGAGYEWGNRRKGTKRIVQFFPTYGFFLTREEAEAELEHIRKSRYVCPIDEERPEVVISFKVFEITAHEHMAMQKAAEEEKKKHSF